MLGGHHVTHKINVCRCMYAGRPGGVGSLPRYRTLPVQRGAFYICRDGPTQSSMGLIPPTILSAHWQPKNVSSMPGSASPASGQVVPRAKRGRSITCGYKGLQQMQGCRLRAVPGVQHRAGPVHNGPIRSPGQVQNVQVLQRNTPTSADGFIRGWNWQGCGCRQGASRLLQLLTRSACQTPYQGRAVKNDP